MPQNDSENMEKTFVKLENVSLHYKKVHALRNISLDVPPRKLVGLIGPDGVGKSSLLSLITGAHAMEPGGGKITVLGGDIADEGHRTRVCPRIAYMPQGLGKNLYFTLTVEENLQYFARLFGFGEQERRERIDRLTKSTGLYPFLNRPAGKLSGGMKQKLGLCCALIHDPDLLVLDEPTTGVDPLARRQFWDLINHIRTEQPQMGIMVATAYMDEAQRFDWLIAMDGGVVLDTGSPQELLEKTGSNNLDTAFIRLLPEEKRANHVELVVPPLEIPEGGNNIAIEAHGMTKRFGNFTAVDHVSFTIQRGEIFGFLGSNGCGKSTTMRMLTGLIPLTEGDAELFGRPVTENDEQARLQLGYMTQAFSLYNELTVEQNLKLYARLYRIPDDKVDSQVHEMMERFGLMEVRNELPSALPMGIKQRLSLAAAVVHHPQVVILDEPTSGVDPVARDTFWQMIIELSRRDKVTIFITTHFMNEAERCDRISLMHCGKSLVCDTPAQIIKNRNAATLEEAFIGYLEDADPGSNQVNELPPQKKSETDVGAMNEKWTSRTFNFGRCYACFWREFLELMRDPIRLTLALFGAILLMLVMGYGITMDVENLSFAVLDWDKSELSQDYTLNIAGSRYFKEHNEIKSHDELDERMRSGELSVAVEIPADFGKKIERGDSPEVIYWVDGAMPSRASTVNGYVQAMHLEWMQEYIKEHTPYKVASPVDVEIRYRYNPDIESLPAMVPAVIPLLLIMIPAILAALSIVREKEMGSITNLYVTPLSRVEFLIGKQIPYVILSVASSFLLIWMAVFIFHVRLTGSLPCLMIAMIIYAFVATGMGLLASSVTRSQIAVIFLTMIGTMMPATQYSGLMNPVSTLTGAARVIGAIYPASHMLIITRGIFNKALGFTELTGELIPMLILAPILSIISISLIRKQEK